MIEKTPIRSCFGCGTSAAGGAGTESYIELWNAATTGVVGHVKRVVIISAEDGAGTTVKIKYHTAQQGSTALTSGNALLGGSAPAIAIYGNNAASVSGTQVGGLIITTATRTEFEFKEPIKIPPGKSLIFENTTAVKAITMLQIEWDEVPI
jgi:hypothetical protein